MKAEASSEAEDSPPHERNTVLDVLRGVAMIGVVLSHVMVGVSGAGLSHVGFGRVNAALYLVHMPIFALLAGLSWLNPAKSAVIGFLSGIECVRFCTSM